MNSVLSAFIWKPTPFAGRVAESTSYDENRFATGVFYMDNIYIKRCVNSFLNSLFFSIEYDFLQIIFINNLALPNGIVTTKIQIEQVYFQEALDHLRSLRP